MILQNFTDAISDEFNSTFMLVNPNTLANLLYESDLAEVESIIKKYLGDVHVMFHRTYQLGKGSLDKDIWLIHVVSIRDLQ